jgi:parallel beta-helix repeat protein
MDRDIPECRLMIQTGASLQGGIDRAPEGAVLYPAAGVWQENILIGKSLTLRGLGVGKTIINGCRKGYPVVWIMPSAGLEEIMVRLEGLEIAGAHGDCADWRRGVCSDGLLIQGPARVDLSDSKIVGNQRSGISLWNSARVAISNSTVAENDHYGLWLWNSAYARISDSVILENGIAIENSSDPERDGIALRDRAWATIAHSTVAGNGHYGLWLADEARLRVSSSTISGNRQGGVWLRDGAQANIVDSLISENGDGIQLAGRARATIVGNRIIKNRGYGVLLYHRPCYRTGEAFAGHILGRANIIADSEAAEGNGLGAICPEELEFLSAEVGGEYP